VFEVVRSPACSWHLSVVGLSDVPVVPFAVAGGSFTV
jgi:hypothetical protein